MFRGYLIYLSQYTEKKTLQLFPLKLFLILKPSRICTNVWQTVSSSADNLWKKCLLRVIWKFHRWMSVCLNLCFNDSSCSTPSIQHSQSSVLWQFWSPGAWVADTQTAFSFCSHKKITQQIFLIYFISMKSRVWGFFLRAEKLVQLMFKEERRAVGLQILSRQTCSF